MYCILFYRCRCQYFCDAITRIKIIGLGRKTSPSMISFRVFTITHMCLRAMYRAQKNPYTNPKKNPKKTPKTPPKIQKKPNVEYLVSQTFFDMKATGWSEYFCFLASITFVTEPCWPLCTTASRYSAMQPTFFAITSIAHITSAEPHLFFGGARSDPPPKPGLGRTSADPLQFGFPKIRN